MYFYRVSKKCGLISGKSFFTMKDSEVRDPFDIFKGEEVLYWEHKNDSTGEIDLTCDNRSKTTLFP